MIKISGGMKIVIAGLLFVFGTVILMQVGLNKQKSSEKIIRLDCFWRDENKWPLCFRIKQSEIDSTVPYTVVLDGDRVLQISFRGMAVNFDLAISDSAIASYTETLKIRPNDYSALANRGEAYYYKDDFNLAIADYTEALKIRPNDYSALASRGKAYYAKGDFNLAIADYNKVLRIKPDFLGALNYRGMAYHAKGDFDLAIADYNEALIKPDFSSALNNRGMAYHAKGDFNLAIADYNEALKIARDNISIAPILNNRGRAYADKGAFAFAIKDFETVLKMDTNEIVAGDYVKARESLEKIKIHQVEIRD